MTNVLPGINPMVEIPDGAISTVVQLVVSAGFASLVLQLLLVRQNRRKVEGEASGQEANAAATLSGAALAQMERAHQNEEQARNETEEMRREVDRLWNDNNRMRWEQVSDKNRISLLEAFILAQQLPLPTSPEIVLPETQERQQNTRIPRPEDTPEIGP